MKFYVLYADGYYDDGNVGTHECNSAQEASDFISTRLAKAENPDVSHYRVIEGRELTIRPIQYATRIEIGPETA
jgi:hypothetical protein